MSWISHWWRPPVWPVACAGSPLETSCCDELLPEKLEVSVSSQAWSLEGTLFRFILYWQRWVTLKFNLKVGPKQQGFLWSVWIISHSSLQESHLNDDLRFCSSYRSQTNMEAILIGLAPGWLVGIICFWIIKIQSDATSVSFPSGLTADSGVRATELT